MTLTLKQNKNCSKFWGNSSDSSEIIALVEEKVIQIAPFLPPHSSVPGCVSLSPGSFYNWFLLLSSSAPSHPEGSQSHRHDGENPEGRRGQVDLVAVFGWALPFLYSSRSCFSKRGLLLEKVPWWQKRVKCLFLPCPLILLRSTTKIKF